ncbi:patatin-like phospholipase family protein [Actinoplanes sp. NPDC049118]|uniref:patatin-like phospholipase family protein n=1 Tax=Actinoplanes sp. NPDC049118 TaxID=3155769 RepID=UPI0033EB2858
MEKRALVLGGGGVSGVAWEIGLLHGLAERGVDLTTADLFVGTSAGSVVAAQLTGGAGVAELYEHESADAAGNRSAAIGTRVLLGFVLARRPGPRPGAAAPGRAEGPHGAGVRAAHGHRLGRRRDDWPAARLLIPAGA